MTNHLSFPGTDEVPRTWYLPWESPSKRGTSWSSYGYYYSHLQLGNLRYREATCSACSPSKVEADVGLSLLPSSESTFASRQLLPFPLCLPFPWNCKKTNVIFCLLCALSFQNCALGILWMLVNVALCGYPTSLRRNNITTLCFKENDTAAEKL